MNFNNQNGCNVSETYTTSVNVYKPEKPIIGGNHSNCNKVNNYYNILNYNENYNYEWFLANNNGTISNVTNGTILIEWEDISNILCPFDTIKVIVTDGNNCKDSSLFLVYDCCDNNQNAQNYYTITTFSGTQYLNDPNSYIFNEDVIIDGNVTFSDTYVHMGPNTKIILNQNATLIISNTTVSSIVDCCNDMWDGIYVENSSAKLYTENYSIVQNAKNAVISRNRGYISLINTIFADNYRSVVIEDNNLTLPYDLTAYPAIIGGNTFTVSANYNGYHLLTRQPYTNMQAYSGIETKNIFNLTIGDYTDIENRNIFEHLYCGIKGLNSNLYIYNNSFFNIKLPQGVSVPAYGADPTAIYQPTCIHSVFNNSLKNLPVSELVVGQSIYQYTNNNNMINCQNGVYSYNQRVEILGNLIESDTYGIWTKNIFDLSKINENTIGSNQYPSAYGIFANNIIPTKLNLEVNNNLVYPIMDGICIANCLSEPRSGQYQVNVKDNFINFNPIFINAAQKYSSGIKSHNNIGIFISCNQIIQSSNAPIPTTPLGLLGINTIKTPHAHVLNNYTTKMGAGINVFGNCNFTRYDCNQIEDSYYGFLFNKDAIITNQGNASVNTDNKWIGNYSLGTDFRKIWEFNSLLDPFNPVKWHVQNSLGSIFDPENMGVNPTNSLIIPNYNNNGTTTCINCQFKSFGSSAINAELREKLYGKVVRNENNYVILNEQYKIYDITALYLVLKSDTSIMYLGDTADAAYQQFYAAQQAGNIGKFEEVQNLIKDGEIQLAISKNEGVQDQKLIDYYLKTATEIYLKTYCADNYNLTAQQIDFLTALANITPWEGGEGVYIARYMLGIDIDYSNPNVQFSTGDGGIAEAEMLSVFPNPASNSITLSFAYAIEGGFVIEVYNHTGIKVLSETVNQTQAQYQLNTAKLKNGIYFISVRSNTETFKSKFTIIK